MSPAGALALKLVLTPILVGAASLAGRRWGAAVGGWLVGIPFTSAPIAFFLAVDLGQEFAARAAAGIMAGTASQAAFCLAYAWIAQRRGWVASLLAATVAFLVATLLLDAVALPAPAIFVVMIVVLVVALYLMPAAEARSGPPVTFPRWDIPARMFIATTFVLVLTTAAPFLGARLAGLLAPFPLYGTVLATFAHRLQGADQAAGVLRGLLLGLFAFATFFLVVSLALPSGIAEAFLLAAAFGLGVQGATLAAGRRIGLA